MHAEHVSRPWMNGGSVLDVNWIPTFLVDPAVIGTPSTQQMNTATTLQMEHRDFAEGVIALFSRWTARPGVSRR